MLKPPKPGSPKAWLIVIILIILLIGWMLLYTLAP